MAEIVPASRFHGKIRTIVAGLLSMLFNSTTKNKRKGTRKVSRASISDMLLGPTLAVEALTRRLSKSSTAERTQLHSLEISGNSSNAGCLVRYGTKGGLYTNLFGSMSISYKGEETITGVVVYSKLYLSQSNVAITAGGVGHKFVEVEVCLSGAALAYEDIEMTVLVEGPPEEDCRPADGPQEEERVPVESSPEKKCVPVKGQQEEVPVESSLEEECVPAKSPHVAEGVPAESSQEHKYVPVESSQLEECGSAEGPQEDKCVPLESPLETECGAADCHSETIFVSADAQPKQECVH